MADDNTSQFEPGSIAEFITGDGPQLAVCGPDAKNAKMVECAYFNQVTGKFDVTSFTPGLLKPVTTS